MADLELPVILDPVDAPELLEPQDPVEILVSLATLAEVSPVVPVTQVLQDPQDLQVILVMAQPLSSSAPMSATTGVCRQSLRATIVSARRDIELNQSRQPVDKETFSAAILAAMVTSVGATPEMPAVRN